jgi:predicted nucleotidyltransferase
MENMTPAKIKILKDLKSDLSASLQDNLKDVVLFGSQLSEKNKTDSDYDILIIVRSKKDWKIERQISDICYGIDLKYNIITDTHVLGEEEIQTLRGRQPIFVNALNQGYHA